MITFRKISLGLCAVITLSFTSLSAQNVKWLAEDFNLKGYPKKVHITSYDPKDKTQTLINGEQRKSFTDDYILEFNQKREVTDRQNFINTAKDRYVKYFYDNKRHLTKEVLYELSGKIVSRIEYKYNHLGRMAEQITTDFPKSLDGVNTETEHYTFEYKNGLLHKKNTFIGGKLGIITEYTYGSADSLIMETNTFLYNKNVEYINYKRDFNNNVSEKTHIRNDKQIRREVYTLDKTFRLVSKQIFDGDNNLRYTYDYTYDQWNNVLSEIGHDANGKVIMEYYFKYTYDDTLNWIKRIRYDSWDVHRIDERQIEYWDKMHYDDYKRDNTVPIKYLDE